MKILRLILYLTLVFLLNIFFISSNSLALDTHVDSSFFSTQKQDAKAAKHILDEQEQFVLSYSWYRLNEEEKSSLLVYIELKFNKEFYTYAPDYDSFPTSFKFKGKDYHFYYPQVDLRYDPLTEKKLKLYDNSVKYFMLFTNSESDSLNNSLQIDSSFLVCSPVNCTPYAKSFILQPPSIEDLPDISASQLYSDFKQSHKLFFSHLSEHAASHSNINEVELTQNPVNSKEDYTFDFMPIVASSTIEATSFSLALLLGLVAGFILNFMPCVLPVVAIKINSILQKAKLNQDIQNSMIRKHSIYFSLGILTLFIFLALLFGIFDMIWGEIFQNTYFILFLASMIFLFALSFFNLFSLPIFNISAPKTTSSNLDSYFQGLLTTLIATPCSGPLLGSTLGFSLTLPIPLLILVFISTGLGMALPYLLLALFPHLIKFIPRSGAWTEIMEKILAFILLLTVLYLISLLPSDMLLESLAYLLSSAFFLYLYSLFRYKKNAKFWAVFIFALHIALSYYIFAPENKKELSWQDYSYHEFQEELGENNIIVDFTADWCPTCQVLKKTVLTYEKLKPLVDKYNIQLIRVDMTNFDKANKDFLQSIDSASLPVLALFRKDIFAYSPILLRDIYTFNQLKKEIELNF